MASPRDRYWELEETDEDCKGRCDLGRNAGCLQAKQLMAQRIA